MQIDRIGSGLAEFAPQPRQVHVDRPVAAPVGLTPHLGEDLAFGDDLADPLGEQMQEVKLLAGQLDRYSVQGHLATGRRHDQAPDDDRCGRGVMSGSAQHRPDACLELVATEGLDEVVIGTQIKSLDDLSFVVSGGRDDDGHLADGPQHRQDGQPVDVRQAQIEDHDVGPLVHCLRQTRHSRGLAAHRMTRAGEAPQQRGADSGVIFDDKHPDHEGYATCSPGRKG